MKYFTSERLEYFKKAYRELKKYKKLTIMSVIFSIAASVFEGFSIGAIIPFFQNIIDPTAENQLQIPFLGDIQKMFFRGEQVDIILKLMIFVLTMIILKSIFSYLKALSISRVGTLIRRDLQDEMFESACEADLRFINKVKAGNLVSSISTFTRSIVVFYFTLLETVSKISAIIVYALLLVSISWKFTIVAVIFEAALIPPIKKIFAKIKKVSMYATTESAALHHQMIEKLGNVKLIKIFTAEGHEKKNFHKVSTSLADLDYKNDSYGAVIGPVSEIAVMAAMSFIFIFATKIWGLNIVFYLPLLIAYLYIFLKIFNVMNSTLKLTARLFQFIEPYKAYENLLAEAHQDRTQNGTVRIKDFKNAIIFKNVDFAYEQNEAILENINIVIPKGKFTALVGPTGAGKSTLANLIAGLILPTGGRLSIDEYDIRELDTQHWRKKLGYIAQDIVIFNDTVTANITYGHFKATREEIIKAAQSTRIADFIEELPQQYETMLGEKGARLSGGQKQRIAIARAIIRNPQILILDEATSALDTETEKLIQESLDKMLAGKTVIAIAHRLSTIRRADNIAVVFDRKIVEQGSHEELFKTGKFYKKYYKQQFKDQL